MLIMAGIGCFFVTAEYCFDTLCDLIDDLIYFTKKLKRRIRIDSKFY